MWCSREDLRPELECETGTVEPGAEGWRRSSRVEVGMDVRRPEVNRNGTRSVRRVRPTRRRRGTTSERRGTTGPPVPGRRPVTGSTVRTGHVYSTCIRRGPSPDNPSPVPDVTPRSWVVPASRPTVGDGMGPRTFLWVSRKRVLDNTLVTVPLLSVG